MFDVGFGELVVIGVVALVVFGPDKLPEVARTAGRWVGRTRRFVNQVKEDIDREVRMEEIKKALERNADLRELKQIMNTDAFSLEDEKPAPRPEYQVKAQPDSDTVSPTESATPIASTITQPEVKHGGDKS